MTKATKKQIQATTSKKPIEKNQTQEHEVLNVAALTSTSVETSLASSKIKTTKSIRKSNAEENSKTSQNHETLNQPSTDHGQDDTTLSVTSYGFEDSKSFFDANTLLDVADASTSRWSTPLILGTGALAIGAGVALASSGGGSDNHCSPSTNDGNSLDLTANMNETFRTLTIENDGGSLNIDVNANNLNIEQSLAINTFGGSNYVDLSGDVIFGDNDCGLEADLTFTARSNSYSEVNIGKYADGANGDGAEGYVHNITVSASHDGSTQYVDIVNHSGDETLSVSGNIDIHAAGDDADDGQYATANLDLSGDIRFDNANVFITASSYDDQASLYTNYSLSVDYGHTLAGSLGEVSVHAYSKDTDAGWYMSGDINLSIHSMDVRAYGDNASAEIVAYSQDSSLPAQSITFTGGDVVAETNYGSNGHALIDFFSVDTVNGDINNLEALAAGEDSDAQIRLASNHPDDQILNVHGNIKLTAFGDNAYSSIDVGNHIVMHGGDIMMCADSNVGQSAEINLWLNAGGISGSIDTLTMNAWGSADDVFASLLVADGEELSINNIDITASGDNMIYGNNAEVSLDLGVTGGGTASLYFNNGYIDIKATDDYASVDVNQNANLDAYGQINRLDLHSSGFCSDIEFELFNRTDDPRTLTIGESRDNELNVQASGDNSNIHAFINGDIHLALNEIEVSSDGYSSNAYLNMYSNNTVVTGSIDGITVGQSGDADYSSAVFEIRAQDLQVGSIEIHSESGSSDAILRIAGNINMDHVTESEIHITASCEDSYAALEKFNGVDSVLISGEMSGDITLRARSLDSDVLINADFDNLLLNSGDITISAGGRYSSAIGSMDGTIEMRGGDLTVRASEDYSRALLNARSTDVLEISGSIDNLHVVAGDDYANETYFAVASADISTQSLDINHLLVQADDYVGDSSAAFLDINMNGDNYIHSIDVNAAVGGYWGGFDSDWNYASLGINISDGSSLTLGNGDNSSDINVNADGYSSSAVIDIQGDVIFDIDQINIESGYSRDHVNFNIEGSNSGHINSIDMVANDGGRVDFSLDINGDIDYVYLNTYGYDSSGYDTRSEINANFDLRGDANNSIDLLELRADDYSNINIDVYQDGVGGQAKVFGENDYNSSDITLSYHGGRASFVADYNDTGWVDFRLNLLDLEDNNYSIHDNTDEVLKDEMLTFDSFWAGQDTIAFNTSAGDAGYMIVQDDDFGAGVAGLNNMIAEAESYLNGTNKYYYADWQGDGYLFYDHDGVGISQMVKIENGFWGDNVIPTDSEFLTSSVIGVTGYDVV